MTKYIGYVGTYTKGGSEGIYSFELDTEKKALTEPKLVPLSWATRHMWRRIKTTPSFIPSKKQTVPRRSCCLSNR
nr:beta-propeller fold lactonase family protein [Bacillus subtilis]